MIAIVDIGSNAVKYKIFDKKSMELIEYVREPLRLGTDVFTTGSLSIEKINAKCLLLNNQHLGMVMQWEDRFYDGCRAQTILGDPDNIGSPDNTDGLYPDFVKIAEGFGVKVKTLENADFRFKVKMSNNIESLNISNTVSVVCHHVFQAIK